MPIQIKTVRVSGFRALRNLEIELDRQTVLIGANNVGKTTLLNALQLSFGDMRWVSPDDFSVHGSMLSDAIVVDVLIVPLDDSRNRVPEFSDEWISVFQSGAGTDDSDQQFFAFRTRIGKDDLQGRRMPERKILKEWLSWGDGTGWQDEANEGSPFNVSRLSEHTPFMYQNAQRDILEDIRQRTSFLGRTLAKVEYQPEAREALQLAIESLNGQTVSASPILEQLQTNLAQLGSTFGSNQGSADISAIAKDVRDLMKGVRLNFSDGSDSFSMEYHGMGTRSWSSLLVLKAFVQILGEESERKGVAFHPILALEEPEAHLHPNAQKQIMRQIKGFPGQVIVSTHSPYAASQAPLGSLRSMLRSSTGAVQVGSLHGELDPEAERRIQREIIQTRGDILFSRAWILFEGETEAQALPLFFEKFFGREACEMGVNLIGVGGYGNYLPFVRLAMALNIPWYIFSDGESRVLAKVRGQLQELNLISQTAGIETCGKVVILPSELDYEAYLLADGYLEQIKSGIAKVDGNEFIRSEMRKKHGSKSGKRKLDETCPACMQQLSEEGIRDYASEGSEQRYLRDLLNSSGSKTKYATPVAEAIAVLSAPRNIPAKIRELFELMKREVFERRAT